MTTRDTISALEAIVARERAHGCPMADNSLIEPVLRRSRSYRRRQKRSRNFTLKHRTLDLRKGLLALFPDQNYDPACIDHLAESFAKALYDCSAEGSATAGQEKG